MSEQKNKERDLVCRMVKAGILSDLKRKRPFLHSEMANECALICAQCKTYYRLCIPILKDCKSNEQEYRKKLQEIDAVSTLIELHVSNVYKLLGIEDVGEKENGIVFLENEIIEKKRTTLSF